MTQHGSWLPYTKWLGVCMDPLLSVIAGIQVVHTQQHLITESLTLLASTLMARVWVPSVCLACQQAGVGEGR